MSSKKSIFNTGSLYLLSMEKSIYAPFLYCYISLTLSLISTTYSLSQAVIENIRVAMMAEEGRPWDHPVNTAQMNKWGISRSTFHKILRVDLKLTPLQVNMRSISYYTNVPHT